MTLYTSRQAARKLGITPAALSKYIKAGKVPVPKTVQLGRLKVQSWTEEEVQRLRQLLPKIANGRKTRYQKQKPGVRRQKSVGPEAKTKPKSNSRRRKAGGSKH
jgi:predicted site-specific integrase-resolvase